MSDIIDYFIYIITTGIVILCIFGTLVPLNTLLPTIMIEGSFLEPYQEKSIANLLLKDYWLFTVSICVIGTFCYILFGR